MSTTIRAGRNEESVAILDGCSSSSIQHSLPVIVRGDSFLHRVALCRASEVIDAEQVSCDRVEVVGKIADHLVRVLFLIHNHFPTAGISFGSVICEILPWTV